MMFRSPVAFFFFFNDTATTEIYTLSLHDALPIYITHGHADHSFGISTIRERFPEARALADRKSTRLNSSHSQISYAVFCLKKKTRHPRLNLRELRLHRLGLRALRGHDVRDHRLPR